MGAESRAGETDRQTSSSETTSLLSVAISSGGRHWKSQPAFRQVLNPEDCNSVAYDAIAASAIPRVLEGATCSFFAYGHTGSGKTHTIIGYDYEQSAQLGLCLAASRRIFEALASLNEGRGEDETLGIGFSLYELRKNVAFDLLNQRTECHIRQGYDGKTHIRGPTEMLEDGKVRVRPIAQRACWTYDVLRTELQESLRLRAVGSSSVHDQSSRTHAVLELEVISVPLVTARQVLYDRESELVPVGKRATDINITEQLKSLILLPGGDYQQNPEYQVDQARIDAVNAEQAEFEARVEAAQEHVASILNSTGASTGLGGRLVFVDLAGAEYHHDKGTAVPSTVKQTPQERQEGRQINSDLLALKEVMRACASGQGRIPFRSSPLTMVLREHFLGSKEGKAAMVVTVSPAKDQYAATLNSLKYGSLVGAATA
jgi:Kinesin motor domain